MAERIACLLCVGILLFGCSSVGVVHDYCFIAKPIYLLDREVGLISNETAKEILVNNETWSKLCRRK